MPRRRIYRNNAEKQAAYRRRLKTVRPVQFRSKTDEWETPTACFNQLDEEFAFTTDVAAHPDNAKCEHFYTPHQDGLKQKWEGDCWMNPPYGLALRQWVKKAQESAQAGAAVVCLLPVRSDTSWWHEYVIPYAEVRYIQVRMKFNGIENSAPLTSAVVIFRPPS